jgi:serine/threonine protein kinase
MATTAVSHKVGNAGRLAVIAAARWYHRDYSQHKIAVEMIGARIGQYKIESQLGAGGMGVVYRAFDSRLERPVAIKVFPGLEATPKARQRLLHEARSASALNHPNVCTVYEVGESGTLTYLVMEFVDGPTLSAALPPGGFSTDTIVDYGSQIASALAHAHARGVVHRDLKGANVVVTPEGRIKVLDFGVAQRHARVDETETAIRSDDSFLAPGRVSGTLAYMAPETLNGSLVDGRADIWSLGVMLYEMASARRPFTGQTAFDLSGQILHGTAAPLPNHVPHGVAAVVARCLAKDPGRRYQDAAEVRAALEAIASGTATPSRGTVAIGRQSIAVLPFTNLSAEADTDYFADGLTEDIIAELSNVRQMRVISSTSSMQLKGTKLTVAAIADQLRVDHVLEGSVRRIGDALRITAKLIEAATDSPIWSQKYTGTLADVFAIQETLSKAIVDALRLVLTAEEERKLAEPHQIADVAAYEWYLKAKREILRFTKDGLDRAIEYLARCEAITGENALVLAVKGEAYWQYVNSGVSGDQSYLDKADACVRRALELNPNSPHGHRVWGLVRVHRGDIQGALPALKQALDLAPNDPDCLMWGSLVAGLSGKMNLADEWAARLVEVDPVTSFHQLMPGTMAWMRGDYERAWALWSARQAAVLENPLMRLCYAHVAVASGRVSEGERMLADLAAALPDNPFGQLAVVYQRALAGDREQALARLTPELIGALEGDPQYCWFLAQCYALAGDVDGGLRWIDAAIARGFINYELLAAKDPFLAVLRGDPRYTALMEQVQQRRDALPI